MGDVKHMYNGTKRRISTALVSEDTIDKLVNRVGKGN